MLVAHHIVTPNFLWILVKSEESLRSVHTVQKGSSYRRIGTTYRSISKCPVVQAWTSETNSKSTLCNIREERRSHFHWGESTKSRNSAILPHFVRIIAIGYPLSPTAGMADASSARGHDKRDILYYRRISTLLIAVNIRIWSNANISAQRCSTCSQDQLYSFSSSRL